MEKTESVLDEMLLYVARLINKNDDAFSLNIFYFNKCHFYTDLIYTYSIGLDNAFNLSHCLSLYLKAIADITVYKRIEGWIN